MQKLVVKKSKIERCYMSEESSFDPCPYCHSNDDCEHLLLLVDLTFRIAEGGLLMDSFNERWNNLFDADDENINEGEVFDQLIAEVEDHATATALADQESMPGLSSSYQIFYAESQERAKGILSLFCRGKPPLSLESPPSLLAIAIGRSNDLSILRKIDEQLLFDAKIQKLEETPQHPLTGKLKLVVDEFILKLPKPSSYSSGMARGMNTLKLRGNVKRFFIIRKKIPSLDEVKKLWEVH